MNLNQKNWGCPKKHKAREETIVNLYRTIFGKPSIPKSKQYWTISGQCSSGDSKVIPNCEYDHVVSSKLIKPVQFHGAEIVPEIYEANKTIVGPNWYLGDFYQTMVAQDNIGNFKPAVVNADLLMMPENGAMYLSKILAFLTALKIKNVMVIGNLILRYRQFKFTNEDTVKFLSEDPQFKYAMEVGQWNIYDQGYTYNGTGDNRTIMGTVVLTRL